MEYRIKYSEKESLIWKQRMEWKYKKKKWRKKEENKEGSRWEEWNEMEIVKFE